ncbi:cobalamin-binding protein [Paraferrimonas haliotis]|uniref:Cobalamin-binding protein n=1 Tax=Paraferrimonas haliotis TaxID=2013866 RepID=A0AA37TSA3_9GAMM|nr:cobalamin-binding protein [Paraferrimonas haliotis]GLS83611.1 cobalamin-binding protein [Paraferrimonas haliotis]
MVYQRLCGLGYLFLALCLLTISSASASSNPSQRIVALSPHVVELLFSLGVGDRIVATVEHADYPKAANDIPRIGNVHGLSFEAIIALEPDLILAWEGGTPKPQLQRLAELGIPVAYSHSKTISELPEQLAQLGALVGRESQAQQLITQVNEELTKLSAQNRQIAKVRLFYQLWDMPLMTVAKGSWVHSLIEVCHGDNVFAGLAKAYPQVSVEQVLKQQPQLIVIAQQQTPERVAFWEKWQQLPAVANKQLVFLNPDILHRPTLRTLEGVKQLCGAIATAAEQ